MNLKETNKKQLLTILLEQDNPITISQISSKLNVSSKTVRNYIQEIEPTLNNLNIKIIKKPNIGVYLNIEKKEKLLLKNTLNIVINEIYSPRYRQQYILKTLFKNRYTYTIQLFADELYCSKNSILKDLIYVENWLKNHNLKFFRKQNQGLWIEGNESIFRDAMASLFHETNTESNKINNLNLDQFDYRLDFESYTKMRNFFPNINFFIIQKIIQQSEEDLNYSFTNQAFMNLMVHIAILLERVKFEKKIHLKDYSLEIAKQVNEYNISKWIIKELNDNFKISIPNIEIDYLYIHIIGSKIQQNIFYDDYDKFNNPEHNLYIEMAKEIIVLISDILKINLAEDKILIASLAIHLKSTIIRLKNKLQLRNPLLPKIKKECLSIFGATWSCNSIFEKLFNISINEDEVGYISLHIASAIDRLNNRIKAIIVCSSGIGTSQLVANRLRRRISELDIVDIIPEKYLSNKIIEDNDVIISTNSLRENINKVVYVSNFIDEFDISNIRNFLSKRNFSNLTIKNDNFKMNDSYNIISSDYCFIDYENNSYIELVKKYASMMEKNGICKQGFFKNILQREEKGSTIIGNGITIPHCQENFILKPKICIIKLDKPIIWKDEKIELVFILALKFKDISTTKLFFKNFYSLLDNKSLIKKIKDSKNTQEIISIFLNSQYN